MKKILFTILAALISMAGAWAGTGSGTKNDPYTGNWSPLALAETLKEGDYLGLDCTFQQQRPGEGITFFV